MRFIIYEQPYEKPLLAGRLRYVRDGVPTGEIESWRLTSAVDGYRFLRVDYDAREALSGRSYLYHATINDAGRPEQVKYRLWDAGLEISGSAVWDSDEVIATRESPHDSISDSARGNVFWFPSAAGLSLLAWWSGETRGVTFDINAKDPAHLMSLVEVTISVEWGEAALSQVDSELLPVRPLSVRWDSQEHVVWLDADHRPLRLWRDDGIEATAERLVRYGQ